MAYTETEGSARGRATRAARGIESTATQTSTGKRSRFYELEVAEVVDVVLDEDHPDFLSTRDIGKVKFRFVRSQRDRPEDTLRLAKPASARTQSYPLIGELCVIGQYLGEYYYLAVLPVRESPNHNAFPGVSRSARAEGDDPGVREQQAGVAAGTQAESARLGSSFEPSQRPKPLDRDEGDAVFQGRFGNTLRMGSDEDGRPTVVLRAGQSPGADDAEPMSPVREDVNEDAASVYLVDGAEVPLTPAGESSDALHRSVEDEPQRYDGRQAIVASDRIVINGRTRVFSYSAEGTHHHSARDITFDAGRDVLVSAVRDLRRTIDGAQVADIADRAVWNVPEMRLGDEGADEPLVLGQKFVEFAEQLVQYLSTHTHPHPVAPTGPPIQPTQPVEQRIQPTQSQQNFTV